MAEEVKLIGFWGSPFSCRIEIALKLKGIQFQFIEENLQNKSDLLLKYNPVHKKVPVLVHNGKPIVESLVILDYIDETWQENRILPEDPYDKAIARFWAKFVDEKILPTALKTNAAKGEELEKLLEEVYQNFKLLENELKGKEFLGGEKLGYLDIVTFAIFHWFQLSQELVQIEFITEGRFPDLCKWLDKLRDLELMKKCLPPRDQHVAYLKARLEAINSASK